MSFLKSVVNGMLQETAQETFVDQIHKDTGISIDKLNEVFHSGMSLMTPIDADPIIMGKASVYKFLDELGDEVEEGKHCTCPYHNDADKDSDDLPCDPKCPVHGKNIKEDAHSKRAELKRRRLPDASLDCKKCNGDGCKRCDFTGRKTLEGALDHRGSDTSRRVGQVDQVVDAAREAGMQPADLQRKAERAARRGDPNADVYFAAAKQYQKNADFTGEDAGGEEKPVYRIYDRIDKVWVGKPSTHVRRIRNRVDKLDNEYGAYRYQARPYEG